jgi:hypothetical protein
MDQVSAIYLQNENPQIPFTAFSPTQYCVKRHLRKQKVELLSLSRVDLRNRALFDTETQGGNFGCELVLAVVVVVVVRGES